MHSKKRDERREWVEHSVDREIYLSGGWERGCGERSVHRKKHDERREFGNRRVGSHRWKRGCGSAN